MTKKSVNWTGREYPHFEKGYMQKHERNQKAKRILLIASGVVGAVVLIMLAILIAKVISNKKMNKLCIEFQDHFVEATAVFDDIKLYEIIDGYKCEVELDNPENKEKIMDGLNSEESIQKITQMGNVISEMGNVAQWKNQKQMLYLYLLQYSEIKTLQSARQIYDFPGLLGSAIYYRDLCKDATSTE